MSDHEEEAQEETREEAQEESQEPERKVLIHLEFLYLETVIFVAWLTSIFDINTNDPFKNKILKSSYKCLKTKLYKLLQFADNKVNYVVKFANYVWLCVDRVLMCPVTAQFKILSVVFCLAMKYNFAVLYLQKSFLWMKHIPLIPIEKIYDVLEKTIEKILAILTTPMEKFEAKRTERRKLIPLASEAK